MTSPVPPDADGADDSEDETIFAGLRTIQPHEVMLFLGAMILSLIIWLVFIWVHRAAPAPG